VDRQTRKGLKTDKFAQEVTHGFQFLTEHSAETKRYSAIAVAVIALAVGIYFYNRHETTARGEALAHALRFDDATVGANVQPANLHFNTQAEKDAALDKALTEVASKYHGSAEGAIAGIYLGSNVADKGNLAEAEKRYKDVMDSAPKDYASLARLSLAQVYAGENKPAEAEKLLREAVANPTATVSKESATIELAKLISKTKPAEARKLLEPLRTERTSVSRAAVTALGDIPN
jgi:predicted negative regulator of RcsB-dependent stress response